MGKRCNGGQCRKNSLNEILERYKSAKMRKYENVEIEKLIPYENNARIHSDEQVDKIIRSMKEFGFINPILIDEKYMIIAGHGRVLAAKKMGLTELPCIFVEDLTEAQKRAYILADNKLALDADWDEELLKIELEELKNLDFDISIAGFDDELLEEEPEMEAEEDDYDVEIPEEPKAKLGDVYKLGEHYLMCGDSTSPEDVKVLLNQTEVDMVMTDPPYNVNIENSQGMTIMNDNLDTNEFGKFLKEAFYNLNQSLKIGGVFYIWYSDSESVNFRKALDVNSLKLSQNLIWNKNRFVLSRQDYQNKYEPCLYGWKEGKAHYFIEDRTQTTVIDDQVDLEKMKKDELKNMLKEILSSNLPTTVIDEDRPLKNDLHPTMKPIKLLARLIKNSSKMNDTVLDLFGGSGSTLIACEQLNRKCYMMEYDPKYVDVIIDRWETLTGKEAIQIKKK